MKKKMLLVAVVVLASTALAQQSAPALPPGVPKNMTKYFVVFLTLPAQPPANAAANQQQITQQHLAYIRELIEAHKYLLAGPFMDHGKIIGIAIAAASSEAEAREWASADPVVRSGEAEVELHPAMFPSLASLKIEY